MQPDLRHLYATYHLDELEQPNHRLIALGLIDRRRGTTAEIADYVGTSGSNAGTALAYLADHPDVPVTVTRDVTNARTPIYIVED